MEFFELMEKIRKAHKEGYGFIPFVGNGLSVPSGIPTTPEFRGYLYGCLQQALIENKWKKPRFKWPKIEHLKEVVVQEGKNYEKIFSWIREQVEALIEKAKEASLDYDDYLYWEAVGALADWRDWRTPLQFLSMLKIKNGEILLDEPDDSVIDSFFLHITRDKKPNIGHFLLGHLADVLRIRTILTTNFDSLLEDAFAQLDIPLSSFDVHQNAGLPSEELVLSQRSVVKLNGGRYGLRTVDEEPSESDKMTFSSYFSVRIDKNEKEQNDENNSSEQIDKLFRGARKHLLVLGVSGKEPRTVKLIKFALEKITDLNVFWICHSQKTETRIKKEFNLYEERMFTAVKADYGLFLTHLYEMLYLSPPPGRADFPAFWPVIPGTYEEGKDFEREKERIKNDIESQVLNKHEKAGAILFGQNEVGVISLAAKIAGEFAQGCDCIWLTLDTFYQWNDFFLSLTDTISRHLGFPPPGVPIPTSDPESCREQLSHLMEHANHPFVVFLDDCEGEGINKKWPIELKSKKFKSGELNSVELFKEIIFKEKIENLMFVLLSPQTGDRITDMYGCGDTFLRCHVDEEVIKFNARDTVNKIIKDFINSESDIEIRSKKKRFVYALSLFEHMVYPPALSSWAVIKAPHPFSCPQENHQANKIDNDDERSKMRDYWLKELKTIRAIQYNPGTIIWMHKSVRNELRGELDTEMGGVPS